MVKFDPIYSYAFLQTLTHPHDINTFCLWNLCKQVFGVGFSPSSSKKKKKEELYSKTKYKSDVFVDITNSHIISYGIEKRYQKKVWA